jgi:phosphoribosyl 1,2-cyclic phosphate phosphodiesterase
MDAVSVALVTHPHHDHIGGMGDYADLFFWSKRDATIISTENVIKIMQERYPYLNNGRNIYYKATDTFDFHGWKICFKEVNHGRNGTANGIFFLKRRSAGCLCS